MDAASPAETPDDVPQDPWSTPDVLDALVARQHKALNRLDALLARQQHHIDRLAILLAAIEARRRLERGEDGFDGD
jgi:hypothetical protein